MVDVICDTSFLIHLATRKIKNLDSIYSEIGNIEFVIPLVVLNELEQLTKNQNKQADASKTLEFALSDNTTFNEISEIHTYDAGTQSSDETDYNMTVFSFVVTGLTSGTSYTYYIAGKESAGSTAIIRHGRFKTTGLHYPPIIVKAIALPDTIVTGG